MACSTTNPLLRQAQKEQYAKLRASEFKKCEICKKDFQRGKSESRANFKKRVTCSHKCAGEKLSQAYKADILKYPKICVNVECKKTFYRRLKGESKTKFERRRACCQKCEAKCRQANSKHPWQKKPRRPSDALFPHHVKLPEPAPLAIAIPDPPKREEVDVWRPASLGGSYKRKVS